MRDTESKAKDATGSRSGVLTGYTFWQQKYIDSVDGAAHQSAIDIIGELEDQNKTFRAAQKACEHCDAPTIEQVESMRMLLIRFISATADYNQNPFDRLSIHRYNAAKKHVQDVLGV